MKCAKLRNPLLKPMLTWWNSFLFLRCKASRIVRRSLAQLPDTIYVLFLVNVGPEETAMNYLFCIFTVKMHYFV